MPKNMNKPIGAGECFDRLQRLIREQAEAEERAAEAARQKVRDRYTDKRCKLQERCDDKAALDRLMEAVGEPNRA